MKWIGIACLAIAECAATPRADAPLVLADHGRSEWHILVPKDAAPMDRHAAEEFRRILKEISGAEVPIREGRETPGSHEILINVILSAGEQEHRQNGVSVHATENEIIIGGNTLYAVYWFFEKKLGCRWLAREVSIIPKKERVEIGPFTAKDHAAFEYREDFYTEA